MIEQEQDRRIVVGVDSSAGSLEALRWALAHARLTGGPVEAVTAWQVPYRSAPSGGPAEALSRSRGSAEQALAASVALVLDGTEHPVAVTTRVVEGPAPRVLLAASRGAELMVLGSRGHGAFAGMLLGSVSQQCVQHATCPTVVIPK